MNDHPLAWMPETALADWIISYAWTWPALESIHFVSLCVLFGSIMVVDLRLVGLLREPMVATSRRLAAIALAAFGMNLTTGVMFLFGNTFKYVDNPAFELKLALILLAGINALYFRFRLGPVIESSRVTRASVVVGCVSLLAWSGVIICGRMITFYAR